MNRPININSKEEEIILADKRYRIYALGGWGIDVGNFSVLFKEQETNEIIKCKKATYPVQAILHGKRAKRILIVDIPRTSNYEVIFEHPESLKVKRSNLFVSSFFSKPIANEKIEILIIEQLGFSPIVK
ncbi:MAG: hypothetical protein AAGI23_13030 [Bacteroidota bacterium]